MTLAKLDQQISDIEQEISTTEHVKETESKNGNFSLVATAKAQLEHLGNVLSRLRDDRAESARKAEIEAQFTEYKRLSEISVAHYTQIKAIDDEVKQLQERLNELVTTKSDMKHNYHVTKTARARLFADLNRIDSERLNTLHKTYRVEGYL